MTVVDDYGVTYAVYDERRCPVLTRRRGPVSGAPREEGNRRLLGKEMTMRVPEGLARDLVEWWADEGNVLYDVSGTPPDDPPEWECLGCAAFWGTGNHAPDCLHSRSAEWLAAEKAAREWRPRAKVVS